MSQARKLKRRGLPPPTADFFEAMLNSLMMASPWCLHPRYPEQPWRRCIEASNAGAETLRWKGIEAKAVPCSVVARSEDGESCVAAGHNADSLYAFMQMSVAKEDPLPPFEEWKERQFQAGVLSANPYPVHLVIEARYQGRRAILDLTAGQVQVASKGKISVPPCLVWYGEDWSATTLRDGSIIAYWSCAYPDKLPPSIFEYRNQALSEDFDTLMGVALNCNLDPWAFRASLLTMVEFDPTAKDQDV